MQFPFLKKIPLLKVLVPLILGIRFHEYIPASGTFVIFTVFLASFFLWLFFSGRFIKKPVYSQRFLPGIFLIVFVFTFGIEWGALRSSNRIIDNNDDVFFKGYVIASLGQTNQSFKYKVVSLFIRSGSVCSNVKLKGILYLKKESSSAVLRPGDVILLKGRFIPFYKPQNPYAFDYSHYLIHERISFRIWADSKYLQPAGNSSAASLDVFISKLHERINNFYMSAGIRGDELALLKAVFMGDRSGLVRENKRAFTDAGVMHLLAVSGLHLGIIYLLLIFLLKPLNRDSTMVVKVLVVLSGLWSYALFTGLSSSVFRAAVMFSMFEAGTLLKRSVSTYNLLIASMLIIVLIEPYSVYKAGFWLSHAAVAGIIGFYPAINNLLSFRFVLFRWLWSLVSVSVAAQLAVFPLGIYYFHQFPVYFILSNVLMVPVLTPILILAFSLSLLSVLPVSISFVQVLSGPLNNLLGYMTGMAKFTGSLPGAVIRYISFSPGDLVLIGVIFFSLILYFNEKRKTAVFISFTAALLLITLFSVDRVVKYRNPDFVVFFEKNTGVFNEIYRNENNVYLTNKMNDLELDYVCGGYWAERCAEKPEIFVFKKDEPEILFFYAGNKRILLLHNVAKTANIKGKAEVDYLILSGKKYFDISKLRKSLDFKMVILSSGLRAGIRKKTETKLKEIKVPYFDVSTEGAYVSRGQ